MIFPEAIKNLIGQRKYMVDEIGMSSAKILCFDDMILKVERQCEESENEYRMMQWLHHKIPVPEILLLSHHSGVSLSLVCGR